MKKDTKDFFVSKKEWSEVKDALLECYLTPYITKIIHTHKPVNYIDCFAGKGKFDDGNYGSPILALNIISNCIRKNRGFYFPKISKYFIEKDYADELSENLKAYKNVSVISGTYQENIKTILQSKNGENIFLYIDPFGIKCLDFSLYDFYSKGDFSSVELLINFNSFGFIREACRIEKMESVYIPEIDTIIKIFGGLEQDVESKQELSNIASGDYWIKIIEDFYSNKLTCYEAEKLFSEEYCNKLKDRFKYVVNMPIRLKPGQQPKYRMIHATNNEEGCLLMVQNICNRCGNLSDIQTKNEGQSLFDENIENEIIDDSLSKEMILNHLRKYNSSVHMNKFLAELFTSKGIFTNWKNLQKFLRNLKKEAKFSLYELLKLPRQVSHPLLYMNL